MPEDNESSIRRACSLSDLSMGKGNGKYTKFFSPAIFFRE
jgi:hypothetical protein